MWKPNPTYIINLWYLPNISCVISQPTPWGWFHLSINRHIWMFTPTWKWFPSTTTIHDVLKSLSWLTSFFYTYILTINLRLEWHMYFLLINLTKMIYLTICQIKHLIQVGPKMKSKWPMASNQLAIWLPTLLLAIIYVLSIQMSHASPF